MQIEAWEYLTDFDYSNGPCWYLVPPSDTLPLTPDPSMAHNREGLYNVPSPMEAGSPPLWDLLCRSVKLLQDAYPESQETMAVHTQTLVTWLWKYGYRRSLSRDLRIAAYYERLKENIVNTIVDVLRQGGVVSIQNDGSWFWNEPQ
jgi:hypothetical protein